MPCTASQERSALLQLRADNHTAQGCLYALRSELRNPAYARFDFDHELIIEAIQSGCLVDTLLAKRIGGGGGPVINRLPDTSKKKPPGRESTQTLDPLIDAATAGLFLSIPELTTKRMAHRGELPSVAFPIGMTGKFRHKFRMSALEAYVAERSCPVRAV